LPTFETTLRVPFTAEQMFAVVADVERYPEFLPLCESLVVDTREVGSTHTTLTATMHVGYHAIRERFKSRVTLRQQRHEIDVVKIDGPFAYLANRWRFRDVPGGSEVHFYIDYAFASRMLGVLMGALFDKAVRKYTEAFEARARALYGAAAIKATSS
jgi:coenzyme Q-binding protein COQ10